MKTAGVVFDFYDDPTGETLKKTFPTQEAIPEIVKQAHILSSEERDILRDEAYALVLVNEGKTLRKFACVDSGNTFLSALYYLENREKLPEEAQKVAEANIFAACEEFNLPISDIVKMAAKASGKSRTRDSNNQPLVGDEADWAERTNLVSIRGGADSGRVLPTASQMKTAMVDVTGKSPEMRLKKKVASLTALEGRYALDSYADVKKAISYFETNYIEMPFSDRREYCVKTASRAAELGIEVPDLMERYGSKEYSPDLAAHIAHRKTMADPVFVEVYEDLLNKQASLEPDIFASLLADADEASGLSNYYPRVSDPYFATFGGNEKKEKLASWRWESSQGEMLTAQSLQELASTRIDDVRQIFSSDAADAFSKDPVAIFESMPAPQKEILCAMAVNDAALGS